MVGTIGSVGHGAQEARRRQWRRLVGLYLAGSLMGSALLGAILGYAGLLLQWAGRSLNVANSALNWIVVGILIILGLRDLGLLRFRLPTRHRQVPMSWKYLPGAWSPFVFGFSLGFGFLTNIYFASFYAVVSMSIVVRNVPEAILIMMSFGVGRTLLIWFASIARPEPDDLIEILAKRHKVMAVISAISILATAAALPPILPEV